MALEDINRQVKQLDEERSSFLHLKQLEAQTLKAQHEQAMLAAQEQAKSLTGELQLLREHIAKGQDMLRVLQKAKLKDVASLKNQQEIMVASLEQSKRKLQENAELMAVNSLFKRLKVNFDDMKVMLGELNELQAVKREYFEVQREIQEREIRA